MKKLLLGLGTLSLAILPVVAIASCSSTAPTPTLESETTKYNTTVETKDKTMTTTSAIESISKAQDADARMTALKVFANLPEISKGFTLEVISASLNQSTPTSINVKLMVKESATSKTQEATLVVKGLTEGKITLETELTKYNTTVETTDKNMKVVDAIAAITNAAAGEAKLTALKTFASVPVASEGFSIEVKSAKVNTATPSSVDVTITVKDNASQQMQEATFVVTSLSTAPAPTLEEEFKKYNITSPTTTPAKLASGAQSDIYRAQTQPEKLAALKTFASVPEISQGFELSIVLASITFANDLPLLNITMSILEKSNSNTKLASFIVSGLTATAIEREVDKFNVPLQTTTPETTSSAAAQSIKDAQTAETKLAALKVFATVPELATGFKLDIKSAEVSTKVTTTIFLLANIIEETTSAEAGIIIVVEGLASNVEIEALKFSRPVNNISEDKTLTSTQAAATITSASTPEDKIIALEKLANFPTPSTGFSFVVTGAIVNTTTPTSIDVKITINKLMPSGKNKAAEVTTKDVTWTINGFQTATVS